jgi:flagellar assembly protein FliH
MVTSHPNMRVERFRFVSFNEEEQPPEAANVVDAQPEAKHDTPSEPVQVFTEQDMEAAKMAGHSEGFRKGYAEAEAKGDKDAAASEEAMRDLLNMIANRITMASETLSNDMKQQQSIMCKLVLASARKVAEDALKREPYAAIETLLRECINLIIGEHKITLVVSPSQKTGLEQRIDTLKPLLQGFEGELIVEEDASLENQDCRVVWKNGYAERNTENLWNEIETLIVKTSHI